MNGITALVWAMGQRSTTPAVRPGGGRLSRDDVWGAFGACRSGSPLNDCGPEILWLEAHRLARSDRDLPAIAPWPIREREVIAVIAIRAFRAVAGKRKRGQPIYQLAEAAALCELKHHIDGRECGPEWTQEAIAAGLRFTTRHGTQIEGVSKERLAPYCEEARAALIDMRDEALYRLQKELRDEVAEAA